MELCYALEFGPQTWTTVLPMYCASFWVVKHIITLIHNRDTKNYHTYLIFDSIFIVSLLCIVSLCSNLIHWIPHHILHSYIIFILISSCYLRSRESATFLWFQISFADFFSLSTASNTVNNYNAFKINYEEVYSADKYAALLEQGMYIISVLISRKTMF